MTVRRWWPVNRLLGRGLVPVFIRGGISANTVTLLSLASGVTAGWWFAQGTGMLKIAGAFAFTVSNILDESDGTLARQTGTTSELGKWLYTATDTIIHSALFVGLGLGLGRQAAGGPWLALGLIAAAGSVASFALDVGGITPWTPPSGEGARGGTLAWLAESLRVDFAWLVVASAVVGQMTWIVWAGALGVFLVWIPSTAWMALRPQADWGRGRR